MVTTRHDYEDLLRQFVEADIDAFEFRRRYWELYYTDDRQRIRDFQGTREEDNILLGYLSAEVDAFRDDSTLPVDPSQRDELEIDEVQLREAAKKALEALNNLSEKPMREPLTNRLTRYAKKLLRRGEQSGQDQT
jgi:hypothetical protein